MNEKAWLQYHQAFCFTLLYQCCAEWKTNLSMLVGIIDNALLKICFAVWLAHPRADSQSTIPISPKSRRSSLFLKAPALASSFASDQAGIGLSNV